MGVVVSNERVLLIDSLFHQVHHADRAVSNKVVHESIGLLRSSIAISVVTREWLEGTNLMPSCAELW